MTDDRKSSPPPTCACCGEKIGANYNSVIDRWSWYCYVCPIHTDEIFKTEAEALADASRRAKDERKRKMKCALALFVDVADHSNDCRRHKLAGKCTCGYDMAMELAGEVITHSKEILTFSHREKLRLALIEHAYESEEVQAALAAAEGERNG